MRTIGGLVLVLLAWGAAAAPAMPPHLGPAGQDEYREFVEAPDHRAFAIAPGGAWAWVSGEPTATEAEEKALAICQGQTAQSCVSYAIDDRTVFDAAKWSTLWRPYSTAAQAKRAAVGRERGQRMHDLAFTDARGKPTRLSALRGKVVVLHFWGAWCPPCRREMPDLQKVQQAMAQRAGIAFVVLQAREKFEVSKQWAGKQGIALPLADSGSTGEEDASFRLAGGGRIKDREIANRFPTTYVIDRHGIVVFSHVGPIHDWSQYESFLRDIADRKGE
ncbi:MAG: TlpA family protein disulfide reductase [Rhodocyclales bacterium]|nr:TlpA family protein disulfide reductase [Rhodocyclales bacterium]